MRSAKRIPKILDEIRYIWSQHPELRLGQLISNLSHKVDVYYVEDEELIKLLKELYAQNKYRRTTKNTTKTDKEKL